MKLKYYGTAAAEGVPSLYCSCDVCKYSKKMGGRNTRTRSQAMVDNSLLIDIGPDTLYHCHIYGLELGHVEHLLVTHRHSDHLDTPTLNFRSKGFVVEDLPALNIYGSAPTMCSILESLEKSRVKERGNWVLNEIEPYKLINVGKYKVVAYKANHDATTNPYIYEISDGDKTMLYGHDSGSFPDETWEYLENAKPYFNLVSLDCTMGIASSAGHSHMNVDDCINVKNKMLSIGVADENTIFILHHFSHNGKVSYDQLVPIAKESGFLVSYDTMEIEF